MENGRKLCSGCATWATCCTFEIRALKLARDKNLTPEEIHRLITEQRVDARKAGCPYVNEVNPQYEGKRDL